MRRGFEFDMNIDEFMSVMQKTDSELQTGIINGAHDVLNLWQADARHDAPIEYGTLRKDIEQQLKVNSALNVDMKMTSNTYRDGFNYAYYQHEVKGRKYLKTSADRNMGRFKLILEKSMRDAIKKAGW